MLLTLGMLSNTSAAVVVETSQINELLSSEGFHLHMSFLFLTSVNYEGCSKSDSFDLKLVKTLRRRL